MVSQKIVVENEQGLHMRPASVFTKAMAKFESDINIKFNDSNYNGKSIMNVIAACIKCGSEIEIECSGSDEKEALAAAIDLIQNGLGE